MTQPIIHLIAEWSPFDAAAHLREIVRSQVQAGERVVVIVQSANPEARDEIQNLGATCLPLRRRWQIDPFSLGQCALLFRSKQPRVVHFWGTHATQLAALARWVLPKVRLIATLPAEPEQENSWLNLCFGSDTQALDKIVVDYATNPAEKVQVFPPGVSVAAETCISREELLASLNLPADAQLITIAGPLTRSQWIDEAIWNYELVRTLHEQACLVILGDGPDRARLERYARLVSEPSAIRFIKGVGSLFQSKTPDPFFDLLRHSTLYWQPGRSTSIPTALLAAQALAVPTVANRIDPHAQVITHGENGYLVPTDKRAVWTRHSVELLNDSSLSERFANNSRKVIAERYSLQAMLIAYNKLVETC